MGTAPERGRGYNNINREKIFLTKMTTKKITSKLFLVLFLIISSLFPTNIDGLLPQRISLSCFKIRRLLLNIRTITTTTKDGTEVVDPPPQIWGRISRGGSIVVDCNEEDEEEDKDEKKDEDEDDEDGEDEDEEEEDVNDDEEETMNDSSFSNEPISIRFQTNIANPLIDVSLETLVSKSRTIEHVKKTLSRMLPGRPPVGIINLRYDGLLLEGDTVVGELFDDDEEDEENNVKVLTLDMVPPIDPKFGTGMDTKVNKLSTSDLLDAYTKNAAAMQQNGEVLYSSNTSISTATDITLSLDKEDNEGDDQKQTSSQRQPVSLRLKERSMNIREKMVLQFSEETLELLKKSSSLGDNDEVDISTTAQQRGQRYRTSKGGVITSFKKVIQIYLNINWSNTIRYFLLFLFFGILGGQSTVSRNLLLLGAPLCFILQARPVKILIKQAFYVCSQPPPILLSLLPAPQQAILDFKLGTELKALYGIETSICSTEDDEAVESFENKLNEVINILADNDNDREENNNEDENALNNMSEDDEG